MSAHKTVTAVAGSWPERVPKPEGKQRDGRQMSDEQRVDVGPVWQKLHDAMNGPGLSSYPLRTRIMAIYSASLIDLWPERDLPPDLRELYREIDKAFHAGPVVDPKARAYASTRAMSDRTVEAVARKIARLFDLLSAQHQQDQALAEQGQGTSLR